MFEVVVAESIDVIPRCVDFDVGEEVSDPVGDGFERAGECDVAF
jgi:hypothetical protein